MNTTIPRQGRLWHVNLLRSETDGASRVMPLCCCADIGVLRSSNVLWRTVEFDCLVHGRLVVDAASPRNLLVARLRHRREVPGNVLVLLLVRERDE